MDTDGRSGRTVCFAFAKGCPRSMASMGLLVEYFNANGWAVTTSIGDADMVVCGCCAFDAYSEAASFGYLSIIEKKKRPDARIVVFGCLPGINGPRLLEKFDVTPVASKDIGNMDLIINATTKISEAQGPHDMTPYIQQFNRSFSMLDHAMVKLRLTGVFHSKVVDWLTGGVNRPPACLQYERVYEIKIASGCMGECSYCAIKYAVGTVRSRPPDVVMAEFVAGLDAGYTNIRLIADDVGAYGQDIGTDIAALLESMFARKEPFKLMWDDFSPDWLIKYFPRISGVLTSNADRVGYVGFPVQTGSEKVVQMMKRKYRVKDAMDCMLALKGASPGFPITTHVLVGFPGEDEQDFEDTLKIIRKGRFRDVQAYMYSDRPRAASSQMQGKISERVKAKRVREARRLVKTMSG